jgi:hypothetical protein
MRSVDIKPRRHVNQAKRATKVQPHSASKRVASEIPAKKNLSVGVFTGNPLLVHIFSTSTAKEGGPWTSDPTRAMMGAVKGILERAFGYISEREEVL